MDKTIKYLAIIFFILVVNLTLSAQQFRSTVDKTTVRQNERFQIYFEFVGSDVNDLTNFRPPPFTGFKILSGPNQSTSMQIINGRQTISITFSYWLTALEIGDFSIGGASIELKGVEYKTEPLNIKIVKGNVPSPQTGNSQQISEEDIGKNVFIVATADKNRIFKGEQVTVTYKLYTRLNISSPQISKLPSYNGFWAEELETAKSINFKIEMYKGERYRAAIIKKVALFPTNSGSLTISPFELNIPVIVKRKRTGRDLWDDFFNDSFFGRTETIEFLAKSNSVGIESLALPLNNVPEFFKGAVGDFRFNVSIDKDNVETNEAINIKVSVSGNGNIKLIELPEVKLPPGIEQYEPKSRENINRNNTVSGFKTSEYLIVPRIPGMKVIPPFEFSYFDLKSKNYITLTSPVFNIDVSKGDSPYETPISGYSKEDIKLLSEDIRFIRTSNFNFRKKDELSVLKNWFWISLVVPFILFISVLGIMKKREKISGNIQLLKFRKAEKTAKLKLKAAKKLLDNNELKKFYSELSQAFFGYLEDKLSLQKADFTQDRALTALENSGVQQIFVDKAKEIFDKSEFVRFAPSMSSETSAKELYNKTVNLIIELENSIISNNRKKIRNDI
ncbi:BatD family protein [Bacteroidota bacterium]